MKTKGDVIYLSRKEWDACKEREHLERLALHARVARGELTPLAANHEASIFSQVPSVAEIPINFAAATERLLARKASRPRNGTRSRTTIRP